MRIVFYTNIISPHQLPWCRELCLLAGKVNFRYVYSEHFHAERAEMGWSDACDDLPCLFANDPEAVEWAEQADVMIYDGRDIPLFERRAERGLRTYCMSERWLKPPTGILRLLHPRYLDMVWRFSRLVKAGKVVYLPTGVHAAEDMARLVSLMSGDLLCLFRHAAIEFESYPMGDVAGYPWMKMWGYFVEKGIGNREQGIGTKGQSLRVLWVGRMLRLKHVETIIKAVAHLDHAFDVHNVRLTLIGDGVEKQNLVRLVEKLHVEQLVAFVPSVPIGEIRAIMRRHDVYVFPSNGYDGWGAVVSEALEEGLVVFGSEESGAPPTLLPKCQLFHFWDWEGLSVLLLNYIQDEAFRQKVVSQIGVWSAKSAAVSLFDAVSGGKE